MARKNAAKPKTEDDVQPLERVTREPGVPPTEENTPAPVDDQAPAAASPFNEDGKSRLNLSATGLPAGPAPMNDPTAQ